MGALFASKCNGLRSVGIVTDLPSAMVGSEGKNLSMTKRINSLYLPLFSHYVLLTEQMNEVVNPKNRPHIVMEGLVRGSNVEASEPISRQERIAIYAGGLHKVFGLDTMVRGFINAQIENARLVIFGSGEYEKELTEIAKHNPCISFRGVASNDVVTAEERKATLLVNPRPPVGEYTKYSFPSKNMEYMVSGTPVLTTKLPGMPEEYWNYVFLVDECGEEQFASMFRKIFDLPEKELEGIGCKAKRFVLDKKNNVVQTKRILDLLC